MTLVDLCLTAVFIIVITWLKKHTGLPRNLKVLGTCYYLGGVEGHYFFWGGRGA